MKIYVSRVNRWVDLTEISRLEKKINCTIELSCSDVNRFCDVVKHYLSNQSMV
jgi:hypothetical protein